MVDYQAQAIGAPLHLAFYLRGVFQRLREIKEECEQILGAPLPHLSMGMSGDFEVAIAEGATIIRVGTAIFGPRPRPQKEK